MSGGGGEQGKTTQTTQASNEPPAFIQPYLKQGVQDLSTLYAQHPNAPDYYPGQTVAPFSTQTQGAINQAANLAQNNPTLNAANGQLTDTLNGKYLNPTSNPQFQSALSASHQPFIDQFKNQIIPGITSQFAGSGRSGGSGLQQAVTDQATNTLDRNVANSDAQAGANYFTNARQQQIQAAGITPSVNSSNWQNVSGLGAAGTTVDNQAQANIDSNIAKYNYQNNSQWDYINRYLGSLNGGYPGGESNGTSTSQSYKPTNGFGSILGSGMGLAGLGLSAYTAFSDARLKENIAPVGKTHDGQNLYFYNYKGDTTPQVGLMAQEVAQTRPDAVVKDPSGYLKVDYAKALGLF